MAKQFKSVTVSSEIHGKVSEIAAYYGTTKTKVGDILINAWNALSQADRDAAAGLEPPAEPAADEEPTPEPEKADSVVEPKATGPRLVDGMVRGTWLQDNMS